MSTLQEYVLTNKFNQQHIRGYIYRMSIFSFLRSAREAEDLMRKALEKGEILPTEARFDSNCITPGVCISICPCTKNVPMLNLSLQFKPKFLLLY